VTALTGGPGPRWFTIPAHRPFVDDLAVGLLEAFEPAGPEALSEAIILLPNRRAARALAHAFATVRADAPVLLPQIRPLGDLEENEPPFEPGDLMLDLPPAIGAMARRFELARLVAAHDTEAAASPVRALEMADALAAFLDSCQIEEVADLERIETLAHADMAEHWQASAAFLAVAVGAWPRRLRELGLIDVAERRVRLLNRLAESWEERPPHQPLIAAGSTGTAPAAGRVLGAVARAPQGCVVLPGLDLDLAEDAWSEIDHQHPHGAMKRLLDEHGVARAEVRNWSGVETRRDRARRRLIAEALKPPAATKDWRDVIDALSAEADDPIALGLEGLTAVTARTEEQAAAAAAVLMREALETPGKSCALITPDPLFARRVQARLSRWGLQADSSAGEPLALTPAGMLVGLLADLAGEGMSAIGLLALLKHPRVGLGLERRALRRASEALEKHGLRGPKPRDWAAVDAGLTASTTTRDGRPRSETTLAAIADARALLDRLRESLSPWTSLFDEGPVACHEAARRHDGGHGAAGADEAGPLPLWGGA
jgi:ATP-dependent helicase/nuclease subunit B